MKLQKKYVVLKATTIFFGALSIPWSTFTGFCFGDGRYSTGLISLAAQTVVALLDGYIWFWVLENMRNKIQRETETAVNPKGSIETCPLLNGNKHSLDSIPTGYGYSWVRGFAVDKDSLDAGLTGNKMALGKSEAREM